MTIYKGYAIVKRVPETSVYLYDIFTLEEDGRLSAKIDRAPGLLDAMAQIDSGFRLAL